jgi:hypothetical protein
VGGVKFIAHRAGKGRLPRRLKRVQDTYGNRDVLWLDDQFAVANVARPRNSATLLNYRVDLSLSELSGARFDRSIRICASDQLKHPANQRQKEWSHRGIPSKVLKE